MVGFGGVDVILETWSFKIPEKPSGLQEKSDDDEKHKEKEKDKDTIVTSTLFGCGPTYLLGSRWGVRSSRFFLGFIH